MAGRRLGALEGGGGDNLPALQCIPAPSPTWAPGHDSSSGIPRVIIEEPPPPRPVECSEMPSTVPHTKCPTRRVWCAVRAFFSLALGVPQGFAPPCPCAGRGVPCVQWSVAHLHEWKSAFGASLSAALHEFWAAAAAGRRGGRRGNGDLGRLRSVAAGEPTAQVRGVRRARASPRPTHAARCTAQCPGTCPRALGVVGPPTGGCFSYWTRATLYWGGGGVAYSPEGPRAVFKNPVFFYKDSP